MIKQRKLTPARYIKSKGVNGGTKALASFVGCTRYAIIYRFENDRELLDSDIERYLASQEKES